jgi:uncharacterized protein (TIGR03435 family)
MHSACVPIVMALAALAAGAQASPEAAPAFEVASIKPHVFGPSGRCGPVSISGPRVVVPCASLRSLIMRAYAVKFYQVAGGPSWLHETGDTAYDIVATAPGADPPSLDQVNLMLRALLATRFQVKAHRETRELPVYALVVAKDGPKMKESAVDAKTSVSFRMGGMQGSIASPKESMAQFALALSNEVNRPVLDQTGLTSAYELKLEWTRDQPQLIPGVSAPPPSAAPEAEFHSPSIFTALQEQLGLKLEARKSPIEVVVVDRAERPSEN